MRTLFIALVLTGTTCLAQDSLQTSTLREVVVTGTRFQLPVEKSGKSIFKLEREDLERNAGKTLTDLLNEVPGIQTEGNFGTPGSNQSYYVRGGRNRHTLILIDGVPLNDPSSIAAGYDLRYIPLSQVESVEVFKGGLSTLYGTSASAGVINITLKRPADQLFAGQVSTEVSAYRTFSQNALVGGTVDKLSWLVSANNLASKGISSAKDIHPSIEYDKDGIDRQNFLIKSSYAFSPRLELALHGAYEQFQAAYDAYEFTDGLNFVQDFRQWRIGLQPKMTYSGGNVQAKVIMNRSERTFRSNFPERDLGDNFQGELIHRHIFSEKIQTVAGVNYQHMSMEQRGEIGADSARFWLIDPYFSVFVELPSGFNVHAGARINTHSLYGSEFIYNVNPSWLLKNDGAWRYKAFVSAATSYITPSLYQLYSFAGNRDLEPERALNLEAGVSLYHDRIDLNAATFQRDETNPIDFISTFDPEGNYTGGQYRNVADGRRVYGVELDLNYKPADRFSFGGSFTWMETDEPTSFYKIPNVKFGAAMTVRPTDEATISVKYNYTGKRTTFDFANFSEVRLDAYQLVDVYAAWTFFDNTLTLYGAANNLFDEDFVSLYGYTTRGRTFSAGVRYDF